MRGSFSSQPLRSRLILARSAPAFCTVCRQVLPPIFVVQPSFGGIVAHERSYRTSFVAVSRPTPEMNLILPPMAGHASTASRQLARDCWEVRIATNEASMQRFVTLCGD